MAASSPQLNCGIASRRDLPRLGEKRTGDGYTRSGAVIHEYFTPGA